MCSSDLPAEFFTLSVVEVVFAESFESIDVPVICKKNFIIFHN